MKTFHAFVRKFPIIASIIVIAVFWIVMILGSLLLALVFPGIMRGGEYAFQAAGELIISLAGLGLAALFGCFKIFKEKRYGFGRGLLCGGYFIVISLISLMQSILVFLLTKGEYTMNPVWKIVIFTLAVFLIGFAEEVFFRGIVSNLFYDKFARNRYGLWCAVLASGLVFGLMHLGNFISVGMSAGVIVQTVGATAMGMALTAVYYRSRNIWSLIFIHGFVDFCALIVSACVQGASIAGTISSYSWISFLSAIPYIILTLILLRKSQTDKMFRFNSPEERYESEQKSVLPFALSIAITCVICVGLIGLYFIM